MKKTIRKKQMEILNYIQNKIKQLFTISKQNTKGVFELQIELQSLLKLLIDKKIIDESEFNTIKEDNYKKLTNHLKRLEHYRAQDYDVDRFKDEIK